MNYKSTRGSSDLRNSAQAIIQGIAADKGLFVPEAFPALAVDPAELAGKTYQEIAYIVLSKFLTDYPGEDLKACIEKAYDDKFEDEAVAPLVKAGGAWFLELYHGSTAAFKDMALALLPHLLTTAMKLENEKSRIAILAATSGDTGKAALAGFADVENTEIIVFYPDEGVSEVQKKQMTSQEGANTHVYGIRGNFDDAQTGVKKMFNDAAFAEELDAEGYKLSSANSINIGRLVPQVAYYVYAYVRMLEAGAVKAGEPVNIVVPTGNFGNILAAYYASKMGIPVRKFICASNKNKVLTDFIATGVYDINRNFYTTNTPSMDILISSNLERLLYHLSGGNGGEIAALMEGLEKEKKYTVSDGVRKGLEDFYGGFADEAATLNAISRLYRSDKYLMDTHTAVAYKVYLDYKAATGDETPAVIASTASAYKFADSVAFALGLEEEKDGFAYIEAIHDATGVRIPAGLRDLRDKQVLHKEVVEKDRMMEAVRASLK